MFSQDDVSKSGTKYLVTWNGDFWLCHRHLIHVHFDLINKIGYKELVISIPKIKISKENLSNACQMRNQTRVYFKSTIFFFTNKPLELIHLELFEPSRNKSLDVNYYDFVIVGNFTRFT